MKHIRSLVALLAFVSIGCAHAAPHDVHALGAIGDGKTKDTAAFQNALDACAKAGGGEVTVPPGQYLVGSLLIPSNTTLRLQRDATLRGSPDLSDYPIVKGRWEGHWIDAHRALLSAQAAKHIAIIGPGQIVANPKLGGRSMPRQPCVIEPIGCDGVRLEDFSAHQQRMWTIHPTDCQNVTAKNLNIRSIGGNGDGIDVDSCRHVRIENCDIDTGDDCIALKSGRGMEGYKEAKPTEDVTITGCTLGDAIFACIGIGSETSGGIRNIHIDHCTFTHAKTFALYIKSNTGRGAYIEDISASDLTVKSATQGFLRLNITGSGIKDAEPVTGLEGIPATKHFSISNVHVADTGMLVDAVNVPSEKPLDGLEISNVSGQCRQGIRLHNIVNAKLSQIEVTGFKGPLLSTANVTGEGLESAEPLPATTAPATR